MRRCRSLNSGGFHDGWRIVRGGWYVEKKKKKCMCGVSEFCILHSLNLLILQRQIAGGSLISIELKGLKVTMERGRISSVPLSGRSPQPNLVHNYGSMTSTISLAGRVSTNQWFLRISPKCDEGLLGMVVQSLPPISGPYNHHQSSLPRPDYNNDQALYNHVFQTHSRSHFGFCSHSNPL